MFVSDESSFFKVATKESPSHPEKVLTGCKNSSSKTVPAGILFVLASALKAPAKAAVDAMHNVSISIIKFFIILSSNTRRL